MKTIVKILFFLSLLLIQTRVHVQAKENFSRDTLSKVLNSFKNSSNKDSVIPILLSSIKFAISNHLDTNICDAYMEIGERFVSVDNFLQAISNYTLATAYCRSNEDSSNCFNHLGIAYFKLGDYVTASENYFFALSVARRSTKAYSNLPGILSNLGEVNFMLHQYEKALDYYNQAEPFAQKQHPHIRLVNILINKAELLTKLHRSDEARQILKRAINISDSIGSNELRLAATEVMGISYLQAGEYANAIDYLQQAEGHGVTQNTHLEVPPAFYLGDALLALRNYSKAEKVLLPAIAEATIAHRKMNSLKGYKTLTEVYQSTGRYREALACTDSILALTDSIESAKKVNAINLMDYKFRTSEKDRVIAQNQLLIARQQRDISRKNMWLILIAALVTLSFAVLISWYSSLLRRRKVERDKIKLAEQNKKIDMLNAFVQGEDNERARLARELHDGLGGMLSAAMMRFSSMRLEGVRLDQSPDYSEAMGILYSMGEEIRKTAHNMMPDVLLKLDITDAVCQYCATIEKSGQLSLDFQFFGDFKDLSPKFKLNIYRIIQELLKNITMHANAKKVLVQLVNNGEVLTLIVEDDGVGFEPESATNGMGLSNIQTRVGMLEGILTMNAQPGKGTSVFIEFDLRNFNSQSSK